MPFYDFFNKETNEHFRELMSIAEMEEYLKNNPNIQQDFLSMNIGDPVGLGITKPPSDFTKNILGRIKESVPQAKVENRWNIPREW